MIIACERARDFDRAGQWCDRYMAFCLRNGLRAQLALCRAQYAYVGGAEPASLPAGSTSLADEGVVIPPTRLDERMLEEPEL